MTLSRQEVPVENARHSLFHFSRYVTPEIDSPPFYETYLTVLDAFARGQIRRLIVTLPPQHGKSTGSSRLLPAYLLGLNPSCHIALASYNLRLASRFNRQVQRLIDSDPYRDVFPETVLPGARERRTGWVRTGEIFDIVGRGGSLIAVGRDGSLTGNPVDYLILDDLYKNALEANSPLIRENVWDWYNSVVKTRLHNRSQELIAFTRWHEDDLIGRLRQHEEVVDLTAAAPGDGEGGQLFNLTGFEARSDVWYHLNFEAIKNGEPSPLDPRRPGEALWPERHSAELLAAKRKLDPVVFETMYQGVPATREGLLYGNGFGTYDRLPENTVRIRNYTDTADTGSDYLCSVCYATGADGTIYLTDVIYSQAGMEETETEVAAMLRRNRTRAALVESNNGGRGFARAVQRQVPEVQIEWFHQSRNKESRILSNSPTVLRMLRMPADWRSRWPQFYADLASYRRLFRANRRHDAPDVLTGIVETETEVADGKKLHAVGFRK